MHVAHIEAGLRSYNNKMAEEINRVLTDHCSNILFCPTENAVRNLRKEGFTNIITNRKSINSSSLQFPIAINVGDIMYEALLISLEIAERKPTILEKLKLKEKGYYLATVHRAENTDDKHRLKNIIEALIKISKNKSVVFPIHPRTRKNLKLFKLLSRGLEQVNLTDPISYFDMLILEKNADKILTDSGGMQKEAYILKVPCITLREETEWVETVEDGMNVLAGSNKQEIIDITQKFRLKSHSRNYFGDGNTSTKILEILTDVYKSIQA